MGWSLTFPNGKKLKLRQARQLRNLHLAKVQDIFVANRFGAMRLRAFWFKKLLAGPGYPVILRIFQGFDPFIAPPGTHRVEKSTLYNFRAVGAQKACWAKGSF